MKKIKSVDDVIAEVKARSAGRTRYEGQDPFKYWDEVLVEEIDRLRKELEYRNDFITKLDGYDT